MIPIPAIDLKDGKVVRLLQGNFKEEKVYADKAEIVAAGFEAEGAPRLHLVDLDGALKGEPKNFASVEAVLRRVRVPVEIGGGVRSIETAQRYFEIGVRWVILGTKACLDKGFMKEALAEFGERLIVGIDARDGRVATDGWTRVTDVKAADLAVEAQRLGARAVIYTDISKDGALKGPNVQGVQNLCRQVSMDVIASGGVGSLDDLRALSKSAEKNLTGVIIGKALYENKFSVKDAVKTCLQSA